MRLVDDGIFDSRRFGEELRSLRPVALACGRKSGALDKLGNVGAVAALPATKMFGWLPAFVSGAVFCEINGGRPPADLNGFFVDFCRVGEGTGGRSSSSSSSSESELMSVGCHRASAPAAAAKMLRPADGALVPPFRRGERESEAMEIGDGSAISMSIGVPAAWPANMV